MVGRTVYNLIQIANSEINLLNGMLEHYDVELYEVPYETSAAHVTRMLDDLQWVQDHIQHTSERDVNLHDQVKTVRTRLNQIKDELPETTVDADADAEQH